MSLPGLGEDDSYRGADPLALNDRVAHSPPVFRPLNRAKETGLQGRIAQPCKSVCVDLSECRHCVNEQI